MHLIIDRINNTNFPIVKLLANLKIRIFYLSVEDKHKEKKKSLFDKLKEKNINQLPIEKNLKINSNIFYENSHDKNLTNFKKVKLLVNDDLIKKFLKIFNSKNIDKKQLRIIFQEFIYAKSSNKNTILKIWADTHKPKKIIFLSFDFWDLYVNPNLSNIKKIIIPLNFISIFKKKKTKNLKPNKSNDVKINSDQLKKKVALIHHQAFIAGSNLYKKNLYETENIKSILHQNNILHLSYSELNSDEKKKSWIDLKSLYVKQSSINWKIISIVLKNSLFIFSLKKILAWIMFLFIYQSFLKYSKRLEFLKNLQYAIIDYDHLCPKGLVLALKNKNIKIIATQERFIGAFYNSFYNVISDIYFTCSNYTDKIINKSKFFHVKKTIPVGQYRQDFFYTIHKNKKKLDKIIKLQKNKKIITALGISLHSVDQQQKQIDIEHNFTAQKFFIKEMVRLSNELKNVHIILRFRNFNWKKNNYFRDVLNEVYRNRNISIADEYKLLESYRLCYHSNLIIANRTALADECLAYGKKLIFYDHTHNIEKLVSSIPGYVPKDICCNNYQEIKNLSEKYLYSKDNSNIQRIEKKIKNLYYIKNANKPVRSKIHNFIEKFCK